MTTINRVQIIRKKKEYKTAFQLFQKAAEKGSQLAEFMVGYIDDAGLYNKTNHQKVML
jgi:TPR repeat protein